MHLAELFDAKWNSYERKRFLNDDTKTKTDSFDPESFKHEGFDDRDEFKENFLPALCEDQRLKQELTTFSPPRLSSINGSPYQALVIRYGILRTLVRQPGFYMPKKELLETVQQWQRNIIQEYEKGDFSDTDALFHLAQAAVRHESDIDDSELNLIYQYFSLHNDSKTWKHEYYTWEDVFRRLSSIDRFPKVSRSEKPEHALDTIEKGLWSLQEQAIVFEVVDENLGDVAGIPDEYVDFISDWLHYEMSDENYLTMLETLEPFDRQSLLVEAADTFNIDRKNQGLNEKRRQNIVDEGIYPSDLFKELISKTDLKEIVDQFGLDAHKQKRGEMIEKTIEFFETSQRRVESSEPDADLFLEYFVEISDGDNQDIPPQLQGFVDESNVSKRLEILFEEATAAIFREIFNLAGTELLGQQASGTVADGEIKQNGKWLLWDNKRRAGEFKLGSSTRSKIKDYIDTKDRQHEVQWFLIIAPDFAASAEKNADVMEKQLDGVDIRLVRSRDFQDLARFWQESFGDGDETLPLSMFNGSNFIEVETLIAALESEFS